ncbi:uncharacterized protein LOC114785189 [Denticeps clupeoides]|uniref:uncharacterized protein LOC114785189 n=1 Tax=Denticeps clupeoides TaxID=299321 RepID=UPI0010A30297|nr:uncharacterized protein LOC114785189 [Denticeps clupeoides]
MDEYVKAKLSEWNLEVLIPTFEAEKIDQESLLLLDDVTLTSLIPIIGLRLKFKKYLKNVLDAFRHQMMLCYTLLSEKMFSFDFEVGPGYTTLLASIDDFEKESIKEPATTTTGPREQQQGPEHRRRGEQAAAFNVRDILAATSCGSSIVDAIEKRNCISLKERQAMVRILVSHLIERFGENPSGATKVTLASSVVEQFPCLKDCQGKGYEAWFSPGRFHRPATGFLEERLRNVRKKIRRGRQKPVSSDNPRDSSNFTLPESNVDSERVTQMIEWLRNNIWPASQVEQYMKETAIQRAKWIRNDGSKTIMEIAKEYPRLLDTPGMISQDFLILNPDCASNLTENWVSVFKEKILLFASKQKQALNLLHDIETMSAETQSDIAIQVLPVILPTHVYKIGRKMFKPTLLETRKAFIDIQPTICQHWLVAWCVMIGTNMAEYLRSKESIEFPYVLMLGDYHCFQAFAIINDTALEQRTLLAAVDICFKAFYVFDVNYPKQCSQVWQFLQTVVYGLPGEETPSIRVLRALIFADKQ